MPTYYNECDRFAAAWLRELITEGLIADGDVDERSITDVQPRDLTGFTQCHFFAGIGGWSYALRLAGWPDDRPVWTGSCPCQSFSAAGTQAGGADPRHLWPAWFRLVRECRPDVVFGEQVESALGHGWLDLVCDDLESAGYACGAVSLASPCVGAYDIRQRLWFVADRGLADPEGVGRRQGGALTGGGGEGTRTEGARGGSADAGGGDARELGESLGARLEGHAGDGDDGDEPGWLDARAARSITTTGASFWADAEWIPCRDGQARPVEPGTFPLAHGVPARVGRLRGYGNAIKPPVAAAFIAAYLSAIEP